MSLISKLGGSEPAPEDEEPPGQGRTLKSTQVLTRHSHPNTPADRTSRRRPRAPRPSGREPAFPISDRSSAFRDRCFPTASDGEWNDWRWQIKNRFHTESTLATALGLTAQERDALGRAGVGLPCAVTPYYASLLDPLDPNQPLRRCVIPSPAERLHSPGESEDPLHEDAQSPAPGLVHRYPDRVLFLVTEFCSTFCRYCTRSRIVGHRGKRPFDRRSWQQAIDYIARTPAVRDVLLSGGDPLTLGEGPLEWLLSRLSAIPHVEMIRIGSMVPAVLPQRITRTLTRMLRKYHPLWMSLHFAHPDELTPETREACERLADTGIPLGSQTVLLAGVNDDADTMKRLFQGLLRFRVRPYYLYQCDPIPGSAHFRTPVSKGLEILQSLRGHTTGYAVPNYVVDAPGGGGKIALLPESVVGYEGDDLLLRNYEGKVCRYPGARRADGEARS